MIDIPSAYEKMMTEQFKLQIKMLCEFLSVPIFGMLLVLGLPRNILVLACLFGIYALVQDDAEQELKRKEMAS
jgi:hydrogenase/urease accessory protein HupE